MPALPIHRTISIVQKIKTPHRLSLGLSALLTALLTLTAFASKNLVQDRRITLKEAEAMATVANSHQGTQSPHDQVHYPVVVNDLVLTQLNRFIGTPEGREFIKKSLNRMVNYRETIEGKITAYNMPPELMAVPIIESGYQNLKQSPNQSWGAGLWMFIRSTARNYGLVVDDTKDERLNVEKETDAAMRYILANHSRFKDWDLAMLSYNIGENKVQEGIDRLSTRDAWKLTREGYKGEDYLAKLHAAILILRNPDSIE